MGKGKKGIKIKLARGFRTCRHVTNPRLQGTIVTGRQKAQLHVAFHKEGQNSHIPDNEDGNKDQDKFWEDEWTMDMSLDAIMAGREEVELSHAGGELIDLIVEQLQSNRKPRKDTRDRRDRILLRNEGFRNQSTEMTDSYLEWSMRTYKNKHNVSSSGIIQNTFKITVIDMDLISIKYIPLYEGDHSIATALIAQGLIPCAPYNPTVALTTRALEIFRTFSLRSPRFAVQAFIKSLGDLHNQPYKAHLTKQAGICMDVYLAILEDVNRRVNEALGRNEQYSSLVRICPCCSYKLVGEPDMRFNMLITMDGNNSLKRLPKREPAAEPTEGGNESNDDVRMLGPVSELLDDRRESSDYYISAEEVARWLPSKKKGKEKRRKDETTKEEDDDTPCSGRWKNMSDKSTAKALDMFDETGVFVALCRHGFVLVYADMIQSGEGTQYPLAVVKRLLDVFGKKLGVGYDIGCRFKISLAKSDLGERAQELKYTSLVGAFHGHAHNRLCQLSHLTIYTEGLGLSDLEGAERLFARSNDLAITTRHSSTFHRRQRITNYFKHLNETDTYEGLSKFLVKNYKRALDILADKPAFEKAKHELGIEDDSVFHTWLAEERAYLETRGIESPQETWEMEYLGRLKDLSCARAKLASTKQWFVETPAEPSDINAPSVTAKLERERRHCLELETTSLNRVQDLEVKLGIQKRWIEGDEKWNRVSELIATRDYRLKLGKLEKLIVQRIFELESMNRSRTSYDVRQYMSKALKARSQAVRTALGEFNEAAQQLSPPRDPLSWEQVVEYSFLSEFDLLADASEDIRLRPWAQPSARILLDKYFKMERAKEEIIRVEVEAARLLGFIRDEEAFLKFMEEHLSLTNPTIAHQIHIRMQRFTLTNQQHLATLEAAGLKSIPGPPVTHAAGVFQSKMQEACSPVLPNISAPPLSSEDQAAQEELEEEEEEEQLSNDLETLVIISEEPETALS